MTGEINKNQADKLDAARLQRRADFLRAREGVRIRGEVLRAEVLRREETEGPTLPRYGITVTKKNGNAVKRNRIRRRLRAAIGALKSDEMRARHDYVVISTPNALTASFDVLCKDVQSVIEAAHRRLDKVHRANNGEKADN